MPLYRASLQTLGATLLLAMALACGGKKSSAAPVEARTTVIISGTVTYQRVPLHLDAQGRPDGLVDASVPANLKTLPASGAMVRIYQQIEQTLPNGTKTFVWRIARTGFTDSSGKYSLVALKDLPTMVELISSFDGGSGLLVNLVAEPGGISSSTGALDRLRYSLRKAADGSTLVGVNTPQSLSNTDSTVDFSVGLNDTWWLTNPSYNFGTGEAPLVTQAQLETTIAGRTSGLGTGSRVLAIGDTISSFLANYGTATPGVTLDLHYWPGNSEPRGSFIEYDRTVYPQSYDAFIGKFRYFGSIQGGPFNDDAWDEGVILSLLARNLLFAANAGRTFAVPMSPLFPPAAALLDLSPDIARIEGLAPAMAANLLKSPYLADTNGTVLASPLVDVRDISGLATNQLTPFSAPAIRALAWEIILKSNGLPSPGTSSDWSNIKPPTTVRFLMPPGGPTDSSGTRDAEPINIYTQLARLKETKASSEVVDLAAIFTDPVLTTLTAPFGIVWPRPTSGETALFVRDWGTDPLGPVGPAFLTMGSSIQVHGTYPNVTRGEVVYAGFSLTTDKRYTLSATITPALTTGNRIELDLPRMNRTFTFTGAGGSMAATTFPVNATAPYYHPLRLRLVSPSSVQPDVTVTIAFTPAP